MFLRRTKAVFVHALSEVFNETYPEREFRNVNVSTSYPIDRDSYPNIWVNFTPMGQVKGAGIGHTEIEYVPNPNDPELPGKKVHTRFTFEGVVTFTVVALSSNEKDALFDQMQRVLMAGDEHRLTARFRQILEESEFIVVTPTYSTVDVNGDAASPGTPWGDDNEVVYEISLSMHTFGEFYIDPETTELVRLSEIQVHPEVDMTIGMDASQEVVGGWGIDDNPYAQVGNNPYLSP